MANKFHLIDDINANAETWKIKVRISRLWNTPKYNNFAEVYSIDMVLVDEKEKIIQGTVKESLINKFKSQLNEGKTYIITNFRVGLNNGKYKATHNKYIVNFHFGTSINECDEPSLPLHAFEFTSFDNILGRTADITHLVDVIGELDAFGQIVESKKDGKTIKRMTIELQDESKKRLICTLWGDYAEDIVKHVGGEIQRPFVIILHLARIKPWQGGITLTNSWTATKIYYDQNMPQVANFKNRLCCGDEYSSQAITQILSQPSYPIEEDLLQRTERKFLDEIREMREIGSFATLATILKIETDFNWFYNSCKVCDKKVNPDQGKFWCVDCRQYAEMVVPRYKIQFRVIDHTGSASFVIFNREAMQFLQKSAANLREKLIRDGDSESFPKELDYFVQKKFLFKIKITDKNLEQTWPTYTVTRMCGDANIIEKYLETSSINQDFEEGLGCDHSTMGPDIVPHLEKDTLSVSCCSSSITPTKRTANDILAETNDYEVLTNDQMSSTKMKQIKIEKNE